MSILHTIQQVFFPSSPEQTLYTKEIARVKKKATGDTSERTSEFASRQAFVLEGKQWTLDDANERESAPILTLNYSEDYVDRYLARLFPRNPRTNVLEVGAKSHETDPEKRTLYEKEIFSVYRQNKLAEKLLEQGQNFLVGGSACLYFPTDPITFETLIFSINPTALFLDWQGNELKAFFFEELIVDGDTKTRRITFWDKKIGFVLENEKIVATRKNKSGLLPLAWIPNRPLPHQHEGNPKVASIEELDRDVNERVSDWSKRIFENTDPHLVISSDMVKADKVQRGRKKITYLGKDDHAEYLQVPDGSDVKTYLDFMVDVIKAKLSLIDSAGTVKAAVSGVSLSFQYSDMLDQIGFMRLYWDTAFRDMNRAILTNKFGVGHGNFDTDPVYHPALQQDSKARTDEYAVMLDKKIISHRDAIDELRGCENADEKIAEILEEEKKFSPPQKNQPAESKK